MCKQALCLNVSGGRVMYFRSPGTSQALCQGSVGKVNYHGYGICPYGAGTQESFPNRPGLTPGIGLCLSKLPQIQMRDEAGLETKALDVGNIHGGKNRVELPNLRKTLSDFTSPSGSCVTCMKSSVHVTVMSECSFSVLPSHATATAAERGWPPPSVFLGRESSVPPPLRRPPANSTATASTTPIISPVRRIRKTLMMPNTLAVHDMYRMCLIRVVGEDISGVRRVLSVDLCVCMCMCGRGGGRRMGGL